MKKLSAMLLCLCLLFGFAACSEQQTQTAAPETPAETAQTDGAGETTPEKSEAPAGGTTAAADKTTKSSQSETTTAAQNGTGGAKETKKQTTTRAASPGTTAPRTTARQTITCTVQIECTEILRHKDELDKSAARHLPENGILLAGTQVTVKNGASVYDAVEAACRRGGVAINAEKSIYGTYIAGFGGINEKCCGDGSGWLYFVNGKSPSVSCSAQKAHDGDEIVFRFTCG